MLNRVIKRCLIMGCSLVMLLMSVGGIMAQQAEWTVLVYIEGDNNLEGDALIDIQEMELIGSSDDVNLVVQIDRAEDYSEADGDWTQARRYRVTQDPNPTDIYSIVSEKFADSPGLTLASEPLEDLGEINNGDPQTLIDFVLWGVEAFPAHKYALVLWNHGGTWVGGFGGDESTDAHDGIDMLELNHALATVMADMGQKFEFIGFDTCLMGGYEIFSLLSQYANFGAASEELEPGFGWYYTPVVESLVNNPTMGGDGLAQSIVTNYQSFYNEVWLDLTEETYSDFYGGDVYGQSAVDLSQMDALTTAMSAFTSVAIANMDDELVAAIGDARNNTQMFMLSSPDDAEIYGSSDLVHFMTLLQRFSSNAEVNQAAQGVITAVDNLILLHDATNLPGANGVSIYFPANQKLYTEYGLDIRYATEAPYMSDWIGFLEAYYGLATSSAENYVGRVEITHVYSTYDTVNTLYPPTIVFETEGTNLVSLSYSTILNFDDGTEVMIDSGELISATITEEGDELTIIPDGINVTQYTWGVDMPFITDGTTEVATVLLDTGDDDSLVVLGDYTFDNGETISAYVVFDIETRQAVKVWGINEADTGGQPFDVTVSNGDTFVPTWRYFDENGDLELVSSGETLIFGDEPFSYDFVPAPSGTYDMYFFIEDIAGNTFFDIHEFEVDNEGVETTYRGVNDVNYGYSAIYPFDWFGGIDVETAEGAIRTEYSDNDGLITVFWQFYDAIELAHMDGVMADYLDLYASEYGEFYEVTMGGYTGYGVDYYTLNDAGTEFYGTILYTVVPEIETGYLIDYTIVGEPSDDQYDYLVDLVNNITFFTPLGFEAVEESSGSIADLLAEFGFTVEEFDEQFADDGYSVEVMQQQIDAGFYTLEQFEADFFVDEE